MMHTPLARRWMFSIMLYCFLSLSIGTTALAQTAQLTGRITDGRGAVIQGAKLTLTHQETGADKNAVSNDEGIYVFPFVPPGHYRMSVWMGGFRPLRREGIALSVDQVARLDFELKVGEVVEQVTVESSARALERETSSVGHVIENKTIVTLPLNGRNYSQLAGLMPGAIPDTVSVSGLIGLEDGLNLNGNRALQNSFLIDGMDNNNYILNNFTNSSQALRPSIDAIQEFRVETANYSAEYGRAAGGVVSVVIKSGTNHFHGSAFEFLRDDKLDANDFFSNKAGLERPPHRFNQFGGSLGGPILRNRLFFFSSYQGTRDHQSSTETRTVPTPEMVRGEFGSVNIYDPLNLVNGVRQQFPNNVIPENRMDPVGRRLAALYPAPNQPGTTLNFVRNLGTSISADQLDLRTDHPWSTADTMFVRYSRSDRQSSEESLFGSPGNGNTPGVDANKAWSIVGGETHIFSASIANEVRAGYTKNQFDSRLAETKSFYEEFGIKGVEPFEGLTGLPVISVRNFAGLGSISNTPPVVRRVQVVQFNDNLSWIGGNHTRKFGAELRLRRNFGSGPSGARGAFTFNGQFTSRVPGQAASPQAGGSSLADLLLGQTNQARLGTFRVVDFREQYYGFYGSDSWKLTSKFTLNLGVRYDLQTPDYEANNHIANFDLDRSSPTFGTLVRATSGSLRSRSFSDLDTNNLAPRVGFAWQADSHTVIRGAFGIFYGGRGYESANNSGSQNPPYAVDVRIDSPGTAPMSRIVLAIGFPPGTVDPKNALSPVGYAQLANYPFPEVYQWNLNIQRELIGDMLVSVAYVGSGTAHLNGLTDINQPPPGPGPVDARRPFPGFATIQLLSAFAHASYHSLQAKVERRFTRGFSLLSSYTWSHAIDNSVAIEDSGSGGSYYSQDPNNTRAEKASSSFDTRQRFVTSVIYDLAAGRIARVLGGSKLGRSLLSGWQLGGSSSSKAEGR